MRGVWHQSVVRRQEGMGFAEHDLITGSSLRFRPQEIRNPLGTDLPNKEQAVTDYEPIAKPAGIRFSKVQQAEAQTDGPRYALNERHGHKTASRILALHCCDIVERPQRDPIVDPKKKDLETLAMRAGRARLRDLAGKAPVSFLLLSPMVGCGTPDTNSPRVIISLSGSYKTPLFAGRSPVRPALQCKSKKRSAPQCAGLYSLPIEHQKGVYMTTSHRNEEGGTNIFFTIGQCSLGSVLVARSSRGVCSILIGEEPARLEDDLRRRFPKANLVACVNGQEELVAQMAAHIENPRTVIDLPLDPQGTAFQRLVWDALQRIPAGSTATYTEIATQVGKPRAVRAVAQACGANALAVAIPCHRVIRNDGSLSGYRWGVERKRALLAREAHA